MSDFVSQTIAFMPGDRHIGSTHQMIYDQRRNRFYDKLLSECKDKICVDIGAGTGILTIMALHHGAKHIFVYEKDPAVFELCVDVITNMGLADRVTFVNGEYSPNDQSEEQIGFHEIVDRSIWGEGLVDVQRLALNANIKLIPETVSCKIHYMIDTKKCITPKYNFESTGVEYLDEYDTYNIALKKSLYSNTHMCYDNVNRNDLVSDGQLGEYFFDLNRDIIPSEIRVELDVPEECIVWCEFFLGSFRLLDGHWRTDKVVHKSDKGRVMFIQHTSDGTWWLE